MQRLYCNCSKLAFANINERIGGFLWSIPFINDLHQPLIKISSFLSLQPRLTWHSNICSLMGSIFFATPATSCHSKAQKFQSILCKLRYLQKQNRECSDKPELQLNFLWWFINAQDKALGRMSAPSNFNQQSVELGSAGNRYATLSHARQCLCAMRID